MSRLGWLLDDDLPLLSTVEPQPWTDVPDDLIGQAAKILRPLVRALLLAGHRPYKLDFVRAKANPDVVSLTGDGLTAGTTAALGAPMPSTGSGLVLTVADLVHDHAALAAQAGGWNDLQASETTDFQAAFSHALPVPASQEAPWTGLEPGVGGRVELWSRHALTPEDSAEIKLSQPWADEIAQCAGLIAKDIRDALNDRLSEGGVTPLSRAGLLWLLNPLFWYAHDPTFPGQAFDDAAVGPPVPPPAWPAVTSVDPAELDPLSVLKSGPAPANPNVGLLLAQASLLAPVLAVPARGQIVVNALIFGETFEHGDVFGWNSSRGGDFESLLKANPDVAGDIPTRGRLLISAIRPLAGEDFANAMYYGRPNWLDVLMDLAEMSVLAPAGYPADLVGVSGQAAEVSTLDVVRPMYYPADGKARERVVLEVKGLPAVTVTATRFCEVSLLQAFTWDFLEASPPDRLLKLLVVAGPGVEVTPGVERGLGWDLEVIRVWDYTAVPPRGARVQPELILAPYPLMWEPTTPDSTRYPNGLPMYGLQVLPLPQGVALEYPIPTREGDTPSWRMTATAPEGSGRSRIAFDITFGHGELATDHEAMDPPPAYLDEPSAAVVSLWVSSNVAVRLEFLRGEHSPAPAGFFEVWKIVDPARIPLQGECLPYPGIIRQATLGPPLPVPVELPEEATPLEFPDDERDDSYTDLLRFMMDCGIGFIPIVGDLVDVVELTVSLYTGKDKWGRPMTRFEQAAMAACLLVPGVSNGAVKMFVRGADKVTGTGLGYALELSRRQNQPLLDFVGALRAGLPADIQRDLDRLVGTLPAASLPRTGNQRQKFLDELRDGITRNLDAAQRLGEAVSLDLTADAPMFLLVDLLTDAAPGTLFGRQFWLPALQEPFRRWCRAQRRFPDENSVRDWVVRSTGARGVQRATLQALLGPDVLNAVILQGARPANRPVRLASPWECLGTMFFRGAGALGAASYARAGLEVVTVQLRRLVREVADLAAQGAARITSDGRLLDFDPQRMAFLADRVETLLRNLSPAEPLRPTTAVLERLLLGGNRRIDPADFAEVLLHGMDRIDVLLSAMRQFTGVQSLTIDAFLRFTGRESVFKDLLTGASPQHASLFEVQVAAEEYVRRARAGDPVPENGFIMQADYADGEKGPDLVRIFDNQMQIVESKSWTRAWMLGQPNNSMLKQIERFIVLANNGNQFVVNGRRLPTHKTIILRINTDEFAQVRRISHEEAVEQVEAYIRTVRGEADNIEANNPGWEIVIEQLPLTDL